MCISLSLPVHSLSTASPMRCLLVAAAVIGYREAPTLNLQRANLYDPTVKQADEDKKSPNGSYGGGGHTKTFPGANVCTQTHSGRRVLVDEAAGQICLQAGNTNRRQQLLSSEDSLGRQQGVEDAEWPSLARIEGTRQPWLATSVEEGKLQNRKQVMAGAFTRSA